MARVSALQVAPVKGLAMVPRDAVHLDASGVAEDRRLFLLDAGGRVVTLRSHPQLVKLTPNLDLDRRLLTVSSVDGSTAVSSLANPGAQVHAHLFGKQRNGRLVPGDVAKAVSTVAGEPISVVLADRAGLGWDDGPVSLLGRASAEAVAGARDRRRFRMLVEVDGVAPYEEDSWIGRDVTIGEARLHVSAALARCVIITRSPLTGEHDWDGLTELAAIRGPQVCLGVIAQVVAPGDVRVHDDVSLG